MHKIVSLSAARPWLAPQVWIATTIYVQALVSGERVNPSQIDRNSEEAAGSSILESTLPSCSLSWTLFRWMGPVGFLPDPGPSSPRPVSPLNRRGVYA